MQNKVIKKQTDSDKEKNNPRIINSWAMYDWANSVYALVIATAIFPAYYAGVTPNEVRFLGRTFVNTSLYFYALSFAFLVVAVISPILSAMSDSIGNKKPFMQFFCLLGSVACAGLFFFDAQHLELGIVLVVLAGIGFTGSIVFYNAYLPEIATEDRQDAVSAKGFGLGYLGSSILLILCLLMITHNEWFLLPKTWNGFNALPVRLSFLLTGIWWFGFAQLTFFNLPKATINYKNLNGSIIVSGYKALGEVFSQLTNLPSLKRFLVSFFFFSMGLQTVMYAASTFGSKEIHMEQGELITTILIIQFIGIAGAYLFSFLSKKIGNIPALLVAVVIWVFICGGAYFVYTPKPFFILAGFVGLVMGGIQSLSRSTYSKLLPETKNHASFFSFYDVTEKIAITIGTSTFGFIEELTGSMRNSITILMIYFLIGLVLLWPLRKTRTH
jgi:MFS transporter, UMF1 family